MDRGKRQEIFLERARGRKYEESVNIPRKRKREGNICVERGKSEEIFREREGGREIFV